MNNLKNPRYQYGPANEYCTDDRGQDNVAKNNGARDQQYNPKKQVEPPRLYGSFPVRRGHGHWKNRHCTSPKLFIYVIPYIRKVCLVALNGSSIKKLFPD